MPFHLNFLPNMITYKTKSAVVKILDNTYSTVLPMFHSISLSDQALSLRLTLSRFTSIFPTVNCLASSFNIN